MRECENGDVRERLPELLHERLGGAERERVLAHVEGCADCRAELWLLRSARAVVEADAPRIDVAAIARAVNREQAARWAADDVVPIGRRLTRPAARRSRTWASMPLRAAAAVVLMAVGAGGVLVARRADSPRVVGADTLAAATEPPAVAGAPAVRAGGATALRTPGEVATASALGATFADLTDDELAAVLRAVDETDGSLPADPAPAPSVVEPEGAF